MAKLVVRALPPVVPPPTFVLELDRDELAFVFALLGSVCGGGSHRKTGDHLWQEIYDKSGLKYDEGCRFRVTSGDITLEGPVDDDAEA